MVSQEQMDQWFPGQAQPGDTDTMLPVRNNARNLAFAINANCPDSADKTAAMRKLREVVHTSLDAIRLPTIPVVIPLVDRE